ncbi:MAG: hypothetical protein PUK42_04845 [Prevotellaceae bacterium]|nr:hypothetical protein [Prevotella sp.]MDD5876740.1 hypothetical protein [Prevotellaceae bacterium]MDD7420962.1 hypothetical protein [Prevotellaceae bacterium]
MLYSASRFTLLSTPLHSAQHAASRRSVYHMWHPTPHNLMRKKTTRKT